MSQTSQVSPAPTPRDWSGSAPLAYPDPDIIALDPRSSRYIMFNTPIRRLHVGTLWAEGPAWNGVGRYLVWSDIPNNAQLRWLEDDAPRHDVPDPSGYSNGNTFDYEGRQLSCEHGGRRVVRYEPNGQVTVIADRFQGKRLNSPNDIVVHPDGGIWFTDPMYGIRGNYEGFKAESETQGGRLSRRREDRTDRARRATRSASRTGSASRRTTRGCTWPTRAGPREVRVLDVEGTTLRTGRAFVKLDIPGTGAPRRPTASGATWTATSGPARGPACRSSRPTGQRIGMIRLPETCANVCFGGGEAEPAVHGRQPVALRRLRQHDGRSHHLERRRSRRSSVNPRRSGPGAGSPGPDRRRRGCRSRASRGSAAPRRRCP